MVPTDDWDVLLEKISRRCKRSRDGSVLVSLSFCHPESVVFRDLKAEYIYLNHRSGIQWDLHFVGYNFHNKRLREKEAPSAWKFDAYQFDTIRKAIQIRHGLALKKSENIPHKRSNWRYTGRPELVSFMAYRDYPDIVDWASLRSVQLVNANGEYTDQSLSEVVEVLSDWRDRDDDMLQKFAPGEFPTTVSVSSIGKPLQAIGAVIAGGVAGNAAYELIKAAIS
jgi:hypothetical protein